MNTRQDTIYVIIPDGDFGEPISLSQDTVYDAHVHQFRSTIINVLISSRSQGESLETLELLATGGWLCLDLRVLTYFLDNGFL